MIKIRDLSAADTDELTVFFSAQTGKSQTSLHNRLRWLARNPIATSQIPFGAGAYRVETLCGAMLYVPMRFSNGINTRTCILSILFYVDPTARGAGLPLFMAFRSLADRYPLYAATANSVSARLWSALGGSPVAGSQFEYLRICHVLPVVSQLIPRSWRQSDQFQSGCRPVPEGYPRTDRLAPVDGLEPALRSIVHPTNHPYAWVLDPETIRWKFYEAGQPIYRYWSRNSECLCMFRHSQRGSRSQISALEILHLWGRLHPTDIADFISCIQRAFNPDIITFRGGSRLSRLEELARKFRRRRFPSPAVWLMDPCGFLEGRFEYSSLAGE